MRSSRVVLSALGGPEVLQVIEEDLRDPGANEVRIRILATGVAFADVLMRRGLYSGVPPLPYSPGYEIDPSYRETAPRRKCVDSRSRRRSWDRRTAARLACRFEDVRHGVPAQA